MKRELPPMPAAAQARALPVTALGFVSSVEFSVADTGGGISDAVAAELFIHPQTVGYRLGQLRSVLGAELDDPQARLEMLLALQADAAPVPGSEGEA